MASNSIRSGFKRSALTVALGLCFAGGVHAQATTGTIYGNAAPGETITLVSETGFARTVTADSAGRYNASSLPIGNYTVTAKKGDQVVGTKNVFVKVGSGTEASFAGAQAATGTNELGTITVTATGAGIDVTQVDSRTVITAKDLAVLPIAHSAEAIAMLAPGAVQGSARFGTSTVSFGGAGITENTYYINGFNVTDLWKSVGGVSLPYGSIAQQETFTGGYSAMYGRSDGGVINQVGKRGTNDWHFGGQIRYIPKSLVSGGKDYNYPSAVGQIGQVAGVFKPGDPNFIVGRDDVANTTCPAGTGGPGIYCYHYPSTQVSYPGSLYQHLADDKSWSTTTSAYVGGPLVPNKLFFFLSAEQTNGSSIGTSIRKAGTTTRTDGNNSSKKLYAKLDWNINDSNLLELTGIKQNDHADGTIYNYDYATLSKGSFYQPATPTKTDTRIEIAKYTNYLTDNLNFSVMYGKNVVNNPLLVAVNTPLPNIAGKDLIKTSALPAAAGGNYLNLFTPQASVSGANTTARLQGTAVRFDVEYKIGSHQIHGGIDNMTISAFNQGGAGPSGPGYGWSYQSDGTVRQIFFDTRTTAGLVEKAQYIEDNWQVTDRFLLKLGVRNDQFKNTNSDGVAYVLQKHQLAPRLGFSWDIKGDSSMKLFGNLGRYYLALPSGMAQRFSSAAINYFVPYTYNNVDINGVPTDAVVAGPRFSANGEYGQGVDPNAIVAKGLKSQYQDEAILGMDWQFAKNWIGGAKLTYRKIGRVIDDWCDAQRVADALTAAGQDPNAYNIPGCLVINPAQSNTVAMAHADGSPGYYNLTMSAAQMGFTSATAAKPIRKYQALDLYVEHPFNGRWQARVDYTWSRNPGNTEGQVKSNLGQLDISKTQDWDNGELMYNSYGYMANDRRHVLRARGLYQLSPEWLLTGKVLVMSGAPTDCLGYYYNDADPIAYGSSYHVCFNQASAPGQSNRTPWTKQLDLGIVYRPRYFDKKLSVALDVFNVTNDQKATQYQPRPETTQLTGPNAAGDTVAHGSGTVLPTYMLPLSFQQPRYVSLSVSYDF